MLHAQPNSFLQMLRSSSFGRPPASEAAAAFAKFSEASSFSHLRKTFGSYIPNNLLSQNAFRSKARRRIFSLDVIFWSFLHQIQTPNGSCREAVRSVSAFLSRKSASGKSPSISQATSAYCQARNKLPLDMLDQINTHLVDRMQKHIPEEISGMGGKSDSLTELAFRCPIRHSTKSNGLKPSPSRQGAGSLR